MAHPGTTGLRIWKVGVGHAFYCVYPNAYQCATMPWLCPSFLPMRPTMRAICATMQCTIFEKTPQRYGQRYHVIMLTWLYVIISATSRGGFPAINNELMINSLLMIVNAYLWGSDFNHKIVLLLQGVPPISTQFRFQFLIVLSKKTRFAIKTQMV